MKIYISGPMTGYPEFNRPAFMEADARVRALGHEPVNPATLPHNHGRTWEEYMREDLRALMDCGAIIMLPGWTDSRGACIEWNLAQDLGIREVTWKVLSSS